MAKPLETTIVPPPKEQISFLSNQPNPPEPNTNSNQNQENKAENIEKNQPSQKSISPSKKAEVQHSPHKIVPVQKPTENKEEEEKKNEQTSKPSNEKTEEKEPAVTESKSKQLLFGGFKTSDNPLTFGTTNKSSFFNVSNPLIANTSAPSLFQNSSMNLFRAPSGPSLFQNNANGNQNKFNGSIFSSLFNQPLAADNNLKKGG